MANKHTFRIKRGDTRPAITAEVSAHDDDVVTAVSFFMQDMEGSMVINGDAGLILAQPTDTVGARIGYQWQAGDTDEAGECWGEFTVTYDDGRTQTFPAEGYLTILITEDLRATP